MTLAVDADGSIDLAKYAPLTGRVAIGPILETERVDAPSVQLLMNAGRLYLTAEGFLNVWELTPQPGTDRASYRPIPLSGDSLAQARLSRYGAGAPTGVRVDRDGTAPRMLTGDAVADLAPAGADPQELYETAVEQLHRGRTDEAATSLGALESLLEEDPEWDPDGSYRTVLIPELAERLVRVERSLEQLRSASGTRELRAISDELAAGTERGAVLQSEAYAAAVESSEQRLRDEIARQRARATRRDRDDRVEILKVRLEAVKRELIDGVAERERIAAELEAERARLRDYEQVLIDSIGTREVSSQRSKASDLAAFLDRVTRKHLALMRTAEPQSCSERAARLRAVEDYTLANAFSVAGGGPDLAQRIDALRDAVETLPLETEAECNPDLHPR